MQKAQYLDMAHGILSYACVSECVCMRVCAGMMCEGGYVYARYSTGREKTTFGSQFPLFVVGLGARTQISRLAW